MFSHWLRDEELNRLTQQCGTGEEILIHTVELAILIDEIRVRRATTRVAEPSNTCSLSLVSSRCCERGTRGCVVKHDTNCSWCGGVAHSSVWHEANQWYLQAHYGSEYDTMRFRFLFTLPLRNGDRACDGCINVLEQNMLECVEGVYL